MSDSDPPVNPENYPALRDNGALAHAMSRYLQRTQFHDGPKLEAVLAAAVQEDREDVSHFVELAYRIVARSNVPGANHEDTVYDGSGWTVRQGAQHLAGDLDLTPGQTALLVAEIRNALVPVHVREPSLGTARVLALAEELAKRHGSR